MDPLEADAGDQTNQSKADTHEANNAQMAQHDKPASGSSAAVTTTTDIKVKKLDILEQFMRIVISDDNTIGFFADLPGFSYQYARYTDWIGMYLNAMEKQSTTILKEHKSSLSALQSMWSEYEHKLMMRAQNSSTQPEE